MGGHCYVGGGTSLYFHTGGEPTIFTAIQGGGHFRMRGGGNNLLHKKTFENRVKMHYEQTFYFREKYTVSHKEVKILHPPTYGSKVNVLRPSPIAVYGK